MKNRLTAINALYAIKDQTKATLWDLAILNDYELDNMYQIWILGICEDEN